MNERVAEDVTSDPHDSNLDSWLARWVEDSGYHTMQWDEILPEGAESYLQDILICKFMLRSKNSLKYILSRKKEIEMLLQNLFHPVGHHFNLLLLL